MHLIQYHDAEVAVPAAAIDEEFRRALRTMLRTRTQARTAIIDYVEGFYDTLRRHLALAYRSPADFARQTTNEVSV